MAKNSNTYKTFNIHENTPTGFYNQLNEEFGFDYDPCPTEPTKDGLTTDWGRRCYINPPYGKAIRGWLEKALYEIEKGNTELAVFLLPAYPDVKWFHEIVLPKADEIRFIKGRLKFGSHSNSAPFASMLVVFESKSDNTPEEAFDNMFKGTTPKDLDKILPTPSSISSIKKEFEEYWDNIYPQWKGAQIGGIWNFFEPYLKDSGKEGNGDK